MRKAFIKHLLFTFLFLFVFIRPVFSGNESQRFLSLADIHFDPYIGCDGYRKNCPLIQKLRSAPINAWDNILSNHSFQQSYRQDTGYQLLSSALNAASNVAKKNQVQFVIILGDVLGHNFRKYYRNYSNDPSLIGYQDFVQKTFLYLRDKIAKAFPNIDVYYVVGNNDSYQGDYKVNADSLFFLSEAKSWSTLIHNSSNRVQFQTNFSKAGYYAIDVPNISNLKLIVLNSVLFSNKAKGKNIQEQADAEMRWFQSQLNSARNKHQKVLIAMHIPTGIDVYATLQFRLFRLIELWKSRYTDKFESLLQDYSSQIAGILAGHLHSDWFQILSIENSTIPISGTPSISPIFGNNPGFKVYTYSDSQKQLQNFETYFNPLSGDQAWHIEYDFNKTYHSRCKKCDLTTGMHMNDHQSLISYKKFYAVGTSAQPITEKWDPYYRCALNIINSTEYEKCIS